MDDMMTEIFGPVIHGYSREKALRDGELVDVGDDLAREVTRQFPLALTRAAHEEAVAWNHGPHQDETGRLRDVLHMARRSMLTNPGRERADFRVLRVPNRPGATRALALTLSVVIGPGDDGNPVITVMLPDED
ncbi:DUF6573 family protein [Oerskovia merdavium]|nr:DUF6573 family protein [Oerskovia merdavium]